MGNGRQTDQVVRQILIVISTYVIRIGGGRRRVTDWYAGYDADAPISLLQFSSNRDDLLTVGFTLMAAL